MIEAFVIFILAGVIVGQGVERYFSSKTMLKQLDDAIKASMSRNLNDYMSATAQIDPKENKFVQTDEVLLDDVNDADFDKFIKTQTQ